MRSHETLFRWPTSTTAQGAEKYFLQNDFFVWCYDFKTCVFQDVLYYLKAMKAFLELAHKYLYTIYMM